jgi:hypothetical protein
MPTEFATVPRIEMDRTVGRPETEFRAVNFPRAVRRAEAMLKGFDIHFANGDHHLLRQQVALSTRIAGSTVEVRADFLLRDGSGNIDDPFDGWVDAVVIAETV